jgi:hypothetical protein
VLPAVDAVEVAIVGIVVPVRLDEVGIVSTDIDNAPPGITIRRRDELVARLTT